MVNQANFDKDWSPADIVGTVMVLGFSSWKRKAVRACFPKATLKFMDTLPLPALSNNGADAAGGWLVVWGSRALTEDEAPSAAWRILRIEDGFLRSVGLGADLIQPVSWVVDPLGMYYDARHASRLERLLEKSEFTAEMQARAARVREAIVAAGLTKYNLGAAKWVKPAGKQKIVLVVGQVETDASLKYGAPGIHQNMALLKTVRTHCGDEAYIVYKPHPDVVAKLRAKGVNEDQADVLADEVLLAGDMASLVTQVDEVHVMTSLTGFEALLRGVKVVTYGQPFYAGWGLTDDKLPLARRSRTLNLNELIAGVLLIYPVYFSADQKHLVPIETAIAQLQHAKAKAGHTTAWWRAIFRMILRKWVGVR
ncbi:MAG: hypothetical protein AB7S56_09870 [Halothiobacillaceae bacterium]